jgi:hypothetical protein
MRALRLRERVVRGVGSGGRWSREGSGEDCDGMARAQDDVGRCDVRQGRVRRGTGRSDEVGREG